MPPAARHGTTPRGPPGADTGGGRAAAPLAAQSLLPCGRAAGVQREGLGGGAAAGRTMEPVLLLARDSVAPPCPGRTGGHRGGGCGRYRVCHAPTSAAARSGPSVRAGARWPCSLGASALVQKRCSETTRDRQMKLAGVTHFETERPIQTEMPT